MNKIKQFFLFFALVPEISFWIVPHDTQLMYPVIGLIGFIYLILINKLKLDRISLVLLIFSFLSFILVNYSLFEMKYLPSLLMPFILFSNYVYSKSILDVITLKFMNVIVSFYLFGTLIQSMFPSIYLNIAHSLMYEVRWEMSGEGGRGNNSFCIEPSHMAIIGLVLYFITKKLIIHDKSKNSNLIFNAIIFSLFIIEILTKSVYSFLFFFFFINDLRKYFVGKSFVYYPIFLFGITLFYFFLRNGESRISTFFLDAIANPLIFISDASMAYRCNGWFFSFYTLFYYPFGSFNFIFVNDLINSYFSSAFIQFVFPAEIHSFLMNSMDGDSTGITAYFLRMGLFFWCIFVFIFIEITRRNFFVSVIFVFYLLNITILSAPIWILIALQDYRRISISNNFAYN